MYVRNEAGIHKVILYTAAAVYSSNTTTTTGQVSRATDTQGEDGHTGGKEAQDQEQHQGRKGGEGAGTGTAQCCSAARQRNAARGKVRQGDIQPGGCMHQGGPQHTREAELASTTGCIRDAW